MTGRAPTSLLGQQELTAGNRWPQQSGKSGIPGKADYVCARANPADKDCFIAKRTVTCNTSSFIVVVIEWKSDVRPCLIELVAEPVCIVSKADSFSRDML
jgi:hypothetical protein